jgi:hypothetical protein
MLLLQARKEEAAHWRGITGSTTKECAIKSCGKTATHGVTIRFCETHYKEFRQVMAPKVKVSAYMSL